MYRNVDNLRDGRALEGWMYRIARNAIVDHYRRTAVRPTPTDPTQVADLLATVADDERPTQALTGCLPTLLERVPASYRQALQLVDIGGLTQEQTAWRVVPSTSGMKSRIQRGRRILRAEITHCCEVALDSRGGLADVTQRDPHNSC